MNIKAEYMLHAPLEALHFETKEWISQIDYRTYATIKRRDHDGQRQCIQLS